MSHLHSRTIYVCNVKIKLIVTKRPTQPSCVESFTPAANESYIEKKAVHHYTQDHQTPAPGNLLRRRDITRENTEPRITHRPENHGKGNKGPPRTH